MYRSQPGYASLKWSGSGAEADPDPASDNRAHEIHG